MHPPTHSHTCTLDRNPNQTPAQALGWVRVRAGREDCFAFAVKQVGQNKFMVCFSNVATFLTSKGDVAACPKGQPDKIVFETAPQASDSFEEEEE
jgi:hypothetical protein